MAVTPTRTQAADMITDVIRLVNGALVGVGSVPADLQTLIAGLFTDSPQASTSGAQSFRSALSTALLAPALQSLQPALINFVRTQVNSPEVEIQAVMSRLYQNLVDNAETIQSRGVNYGPAVPGGGNVGTGVIYNLTVDSEGYDLESTHMDTKTLRCVADQTTGEIKHQELFRIEGQRAGVDAIEILGSGVARVDAGTQSKVSSNSELQNCGFEQFSLGAASFAAGIAALTSDSVVTGWELNNPANASDPTLFELDQNAAAQARDLQGVTTPTSIRMVAAAKLRQFMSVNSVDLVDSNPYAIVAHVLPSGTADGSLVFTWGNKTQTVTLASLTPSVWNKVPIDFDLDLWPSSFNEEDPAFQVEWNGTTGSVVFDELEALVPMVGFDGVWFHISGGVGLVGTPPAVVGKWLLDDVVTFAYSLTGSDSELQQWLFRLVGRHLPHSGTPSAIWAEPF